MIQEISFEDVQKLWKECRTQTMLYIHSPFCEKQCSYCVYRGRPERDEIVDQYYSDYLPRQVKKYSKIISSLDIPEVYFGGGTANYKGTLEHLVPVLDLIDPVMRGAEEVTIELHMGYEVTREQIHWLKDRGFSTIILCVQNLDVDVIKSKNRLCLLSKEEYISQLERVLEWVHEEGMRSALDLMYFPSDKGNDLSLLKSLDLLEEMPVHPDEISIATEYQNKEEVLEGGELMSFFKNRLICHSLFKDYKMPVPLGDSLVCRVARWFLPSTEETPFFNFTHYLDDEVQFYCTSTLGIGSYRNFNKNTFSVINGKYCYSEVCSDLSQDPSYQLLRQVSFWDKCRNMIDWLEESFEGLNLPRDMCLYFRNDPSALSYDRDCRDRTIYFELLSSGREEIPLLIRHRLQESIRGFQEHPELLENIQLVNREKILS